MSSNNERYSPSLHGDRGAWEQLIDLAREESPESILDIVRSKVSHEDGFTEKVNQEYGRVFSQSRIIKTEEDLKKEIKFNEDKYLVTNGRQESWGVSAKGSDGNSWIYNTNYLVELKWKLRGLEKPDNSWTDKWLDELTDDIQFPEYEYSDNNMRPIVIALGDIQTGAVIEGDELIPDYSVDIARESLRKVSTLVNIHYPNRPVHYIIGGDVIESFTGKNHKNVWKTIELHGAKAALEAFDLLNKLFHSTNNFEKAYLVGGNHDRITSSNKDDQQGQVAELIAGFFQRTTNIDIEFDPLFLSKEIDGIQYIIHHGDKRFSKKKGSEIVLERGNSNLYNVVIGFHWHTLKVEEDSLKLLKFNAPAIMKASEYSKQIGKNSPSGFVAMDANEDGFANLNIIRL